MFQRYSVVALAALVCIGPGCDDGTSGLATPFLITDTVMVAAPLPQNASLPTALDIASDFGGSVGGGRFPEFNEDADDWDFLVRVEDGQIVLVPGEAAGIPERGSAITPPIEGETFESFREAPGQATFVRDAPIAMVEGQVYSARSRIIQSSCFEFAKIEPLQVDVVEGLLELHIVTNQNCGDPRLAPVE
ncbi:MAG: hypothetical protein GEU90_01640 [Gemmatimonas sp.]|nr:hypothetical protein [Gemmatimonas sp.]